MHFHPVKPSAQNAPWLLRRPQDRRVTLAQARTRLADLPAPGLVAGFTGVLRPKASAVLAPLGERDGEVALAFTKRPSTMRHHRDMWVFPGGRFDPGADLTTRDTALREGREELGLAASDIRILGQLNTRGPISSGFVLDIFVAEVDLSRLAPDPREVADWAVAPIAALAGEAAYRETFDLPDFDVGHTAEGVVLPVGRTERVLRYFEIRAGEHAWGLQGEILHELLSWLLPAPEQS